MKGSVTLELEDLDELREQVRKKERVDREYQILNILFIWERESKHHNSGRDLKTFEQITKELEDRYRVTISFDNKTGLRIYWR